MPQRPKNEQKSDLYRGGTNLQYSKFVEDNMKRLTSYKRFAENGAEIDGMIVALTSLLPNLMLLQRLLFLGRRKQKGAQSTLHYHFS
jgi:hypothetical protein